MPTEVECELEIALVLSAEDSLPVPARLSYRSDDPYAAQITFHVGSQAPVCWTFARELLMEGVFRPAGHGDVRVWPSRAGARGMLCIALNSPDGHALLEAPTTAVTDWLDRTLRAVPPGTEQDALGLDEVLEGLLAHAAREDPCPLDADPTDDNPADRA